MSRMAKCKWCGTSISTDGSYCVVDDKNKKAYYCDEGHYKLKQEEQEKKDKERAQRAAEKDAVYYVICDIFGYKIVHSQLFAEWVEWNKVADNRKLKSYLDDKKDFLVQALSRIENKEYNRIRYFSGILKRELHDYVPKVEVVKPINSEPEVDFIMHNNTKKTTRRKGFAEDDD